MLRPIPEQNYLVLDPCVEAQLRARQRQPLAHQAQTAEDGRKGTTDLNLLTHDPISAFDVVRICGAVQWMRRSRWRRLVPPATRREYVGRVVRDQQLQGDGAELQGDGAELQGRAHVHVMPGFMLLVPVPITTISVSAVLGLSSSSTTAEFSSTAQSARTG